MNQAQVVTAQSIFKPKFRRWLEVGWRHLYAARPRFRDWRFWVIVSLVVAIASLHSFVEAKKLLHDLGVPYFIPTTLYLVPVVYAALTFGLAGALATALWATLITIPNWVLWHEGLEKLGCMFQLFIVNTAAYFLGRKVDRERDVRQWAENATMALKVCNIKYQDLIESSPIAILVIDNTGAILEANPAASLLFGRSQITPGGMYLADLVGPANAQKLLSISGDGEQPGPFVLKLGDGTERHLEPTLTRVDSGQGNPVMQILLRDVTQERQRQAGLKAYTAYVMDAHEKERQRIARELHDDTIQALMLLCRQLDSLQSGHGSLPAAQIDQLREARRDIEEIVRGLRDFIKALRPPILDDLGMMASIRRLLADFTERTKIVGKLKAVGEERRLPSDAELAMFRIAQEALWNVEHHARATQVTVKMTFTKNKVILDVVDNGVGFSLPPGSGDFTASGHLGLISMQERAELLGGKLEIRSSSGKGTKVTISVPLTDSSALKTAL